MTELNCLGDMCPVPALRLQQALERGAGLEPILLITDHSCVLDSISAICTQKKLEFSCTEVMNGVWEILIRPPEAAGDTKSAV